ncbi:hypothetical protein NDU88_007343 [Pleurodeles waltl]|uniref:Uncharacterized protein n=1 Tax=Pleurodeles waltl TaxID=8319 RepID=A0AAV7PP02_PLEWA|nr:hypothetical protein NDU88_007343 [Pleurodeles waltl]
MKKLKKEAECESRPEPGGDTSVMKASVKLNAGKFRRPSAVAGSGEPDLAEVNGEPGREEVNGSQRLAAAPGYS